MNHIVHIEIEQYYYFPVGINSGQMNINTLTILDKDFQTRM